MKRQITITSTSILMLLIGMAYINIGLHADMNGSLADLITIREFGNKFIGVLVAITIYTVLANIIAYQNIRYAPDILIAQTMIGVGSSLYWFLIYGDWLLVATEGYSTVYGLLPRLYSTTELPFHNPLIIALLFATSLLLSLAHKDFQTCTEI